MDETRVDLPPIIDAEECERVRAERPVRLVDIRWALDGSKDRGTYLAGHIPGAVYLDLGADLAAPATAADGRHPLPDPLSLARSLREAGIGDRTTVIAYDDTDGSQAARLVWMLRTLGVPAALLDGGLSAWRAAHPRTPLETADERPGPAEFTARPWPAEAIAGIDEVQEAAQDGRRVVIDARAPERYAGATEPVDARAGHVPGAVNAPFAGNLGADGRFLPPAVLRDRFAALGVREGRETIVYCGSGVTATHDLLALERAGFTGARLYPGSWSQWSADPSREVRTGAQP